ncbi:NAD(P)/FAD-dependent oxidoreductase [Rhodobacteraceae bacterium NNCM2]|nr:NAD(P)/FAD-dependent oxidoreductase [Coraliihabitans acroporae]
MDQRGKPSRQTGRAEVPATVEVVIVGAGFAGLYLLYLMRQQGIEAVAVEAGSGVGGTWYWNRYPGARCDIASMDYSMQFDKELQQEWNWSERFAPQPEILAYAEEIATRHDLWQGICFDRRVTAATYDEGARRWSLTTDRGERISAAFCIMATGCLSAPNDTRFAGEADFAGPIYRTSLWPHEGVDFTGQKVAVIGTGSSGIQSIPVIADQASSLTVFQRTPNYSVPAHNAPMDPEYAAAIKAEYDAFRARQKTMPAAANYRWDPDARAMQVSQEERLREFEQRWQEGGLGFMLAFSDLMLDTEANAAAAEFVRGKIRSIVDDAEVAELLCPSNTIGCKRLCVDTDYYKTFNLPHVRLVDVSKTPATITENAVRVGEENFEVDAIVLAIGFDAMTGALRRIDIRGRGGERLAEKWADGPKCYLGLAVAGFPNLFTVTGPGSPSVFTNMIPSIEHHCEWIAGCIRTMRRAGQTEIEASPRAEAEWVAHNLEVAGMHLRSSCSSWYTGENIAGKPKVFMPYIGGFPRYLEKCDEVVANGYEGFNRR